MSEILKIAFTGDRGVGKTTLAHDVAQSLKISNVVVDVGEVDLPADLKTCYCMARYITLWLSGESFVCDRWFSDNLVYAPASLVRTLKFLLRESRRDVFQFYVPPFKGRETEFGRTVKKYVRHVVSGVTREERVKSVLLTLKYVRTRPSGRVADQFLTSLGYVTDEDKRRFLLELVRKHRSQARVAAALGFDVKPVKALLLKYRVPLPGSSLNYNHLFRAYLEFGEEEVKKRVLTCVSTSRDTTEARQKLKREFNISDSTALKFLRHFKVIPGFGYQFLPPDDLGVRLGRRRKL